MNLNPQPVFVITADRLRLQGMHYHASPQKRSSTCILFVHGMAGSFIDNKFAQVLGEKAAATGIDFLYTHNRGWGVVTDFWVIPRVSNQPWELKQIGAVYEYFTDSLQDLDAWFEFAKSLGYDNLILVGHSYGSPKIIHYTHQRPSAHITAMVLASPADMVGLTKKDEGKLYHDRVAEAKALVAAGTPEAILSWKLAGWVALSAGTYLDEGIDSAPSDVLPVLRNPAHWPELASIHVPLLTIFSEQDSVIIRSLEKDISLIQSKATSCPDFTSAIIPGDHVYNNFESDFASAVLDWLSDLKLA